MGRALTLALLAAGLVSCNDYEMFRLSGYQQESFSNKADILFVVDNSNSMVDEIADLAKNFKTFIDRLEADQTEIQYDGLGDAVDNYKRWVVDRGAFVDFQIGITTTEVGLDGAGNSIGGRLRGKVFQRGEKNLAEKFIETLVCEATCIPSLGDLPSDPSYKCGQPFKTLSVEYLNCRCPQAVARNCSVSGNEEGLEATFLAMCRAVPNPPATCYEPARDPNALQSDSGNPAPDTDTGEDPGLQIFFEKDVLTNEGLIRPGSTFIPVVVSDDGDGSRREENMVPIPSNYEEIFDIFDNRMAWVAITPPLDPALQKPPGCVGYHEWSAVRYDYMVRITNGLKIPIMAPGEGGCPTTDFGENLEKFSALLTNLLTVFELQSVPDPDSIIVFVDGKQVPRAEFLDTDKYGLPVYGDGWSYMEEANAIRFHGSAIPANEAVVRVYYSPVDGMPRDLPF